MKPVDPRVVELLNDALTLELTVTNTYFLHARMLDNWGLPKLGKVFYDLSIDEMRDADALIQRVLLFDGHPNVQRLGAIRVGETAEEMLVLALDSEKAAVAQFNAAAQECRDLGDHGNRYADRERHQLQDASASALVFADGAWRRGKQVDMPLVQIAATADAFAWSRAKSGRTARARCTNSATASTISRSVPAGRCGPCDSTVATGRIAVAGRARSLASRPRQHAAPVGVSTRRDRRRSRQFCAQ